MSSTIKSFQAGQKTLEHIKQIKQFLAKQEMFPTDSDIIREALKILHGTLLNGEYVWDIKDMVVVSRTRKVN